MQSGNLDVARGSVAVQRGPRKHVDNTVVQIGDAEVRSSD